MSTANDRDSVAAQFHLAKAWARTGNLERAVSGYRHVLSLDAGHVPAHVQLGHTFLKLGYVDRALDSYAQALALDPNAVEAQIRYRYLTEELSRSAGRKRSSALLLENHADGKFNLEGQRRIRSHRSGWAFGQRVLERFHNERGVLFDTRIEDQFAFQHWQAGIREPVALDRLKQQGVFGILATSEEKGIVPYTQPWVGLLHNPPNMPHWFHYHESPQSIFAKDIWKRSLNTCLGLFALSEYQATWLRQTTQLPVSVIPFPTELDVLQFDFEKFLSNPNKKVVQVGWWLRQQSAIYRLPLARDNALGYEKIRLVPSFFGDADLYLDTLTARELEVHRWNPDPRLRANTRKLQHVNNAAYDELLSENIALAILYDASANNLVVECIARATPLLVNPLPAVVEYLGKDYPLYVDDLDQAAAKASDLDLLWQAHRYLMAPHLRRKISLEFFLEKVEQSALYRALPMK